jgi:hypothetical protein
LPVKQDLLWYFEHRNLNRLDLTGDGSFQPFGNPPDSMYFADSTHLVGGRYDVGAGYYLAVIELSSAVDYTLSWTNRVAFGSSDIALVRLYGDHLYWPHRGIKGVEGVVLRVSLKGAIDPTVAAEMSELVSRRIVHGDSAVTSKGMVWADGNVLHFVPHPSGD